MHAGQHKQTTRPLWTHTTRTAGGGAGVSPRIAPTPCQSRPCARRLRIHIDWRREPALNPAQCPSRWGGLGAQGSRERTQGLEQTLSEELFQLGDLGPTVLSRSLGSIVPARLVPSPAAPTRLPQYRAACSFRLFHSFPLPEFSSETRKRAAVSTMADKHTCDSAEGAARGSRWPMISIEEANRISLLHTVPLPAAAVPLALSLGRVLAEDVLAREVRMSRCETWRPECGAHDMLTCASRSPFPRCRR